jgi:hypothetical protein
MSSSAKPKPVQALKHSAPKRREYTYYAFDIETKRNGQLIEGAIGNTEFQEFFDSMTRLIEKMEELTGKGVIFLAHWADGMEFPHIIKEIRESPKLRSLYNIEPTLSGDRMVRLVLTNTETKKVIIIHDTYALSGASLADWSSKFGGDYVKTKDIDFDKREYNPVTDREYLRRDIESTYASQVNMADKIWELFGSNVGITAASTAMKAFKVAIKDELVYFRLNPMTEDFCREGYYGGYVHPGYDNYIHHDVVSRDITGAYGARMKYAFPIGNPIQTRSFIEGKHGMYRCHVTAVNPPFPMVPYRDDRNMLRWLGVPGDDCETVITGIEVSYFRTHGYEVFVIEGVYWEKESYVFKEFMETCEEMEKKGGVYKAIAKLMRNSLYGRFGSRKYCDRVVITDEPKEGYVQMCDPKNGKPFDDVYMVQEIVDAEYIQPHWAAHITAYQRLALFDIMLRVGFGHVLGVDTDSVKMEQYVDRSIAWDEGTGYGSTHIEGEWSLYRSHGPKNYVTEKDAVYALKSKGIPKKKVTQQMMIDHLNRTSDTQPIIVHFESLTKGLTMLKHDGQASLISYPHRTLGELHSGTWLIDDEQKFIVRPNPCNTLLQHCP